MGLSALPFSSALGLDRCSSEGRVLSGIGGDRLRFGVVKAWCAEALTDGEVRLRAPSKPMLVAVLFETAVEA
jgi:hypothetical protein